MVKGKYAHRADTRLKVLESEALQKSQEKINDLTKQLEQIKQELHLAKTGMHSKAMQAAQGMSAREKQHLRDQMASMAHQHKEERKRYALLMWEILHRTTFGTPAPFVMHPSDKSESHELWIKVNWEIATLFFNDYDEIWDFFRVVEGMTWRLAGGDGSGQTQREANRWLMKGSMKKLMMVRVGKMRAYFDRIYHSRQTRIPEPVKSFAEIAPAKTSADRKEDMIEKLKEKA